MSSLEETIANLASNLRKKGRKVGIEESLDAANALKILHSSDPEIFSAAIKATLSKDFVLKDANEESSKGRSEKIIHFGAQDDPQRIGRGLPQAGQEQGEPDAKDLHFEFGIYSPHSANTAQSPKTSRMEEKLWSKGVNRLKNSILTLEGHRFERNSSGQADPRKTMQLELRKAGDSPIVFRSKKKISKAKVVFLCDVSGSMNESSSIIVNLCCSVKRIIQKSEIFLFSTKLKRITYLASRYSPSELALRIPKLDLGFGGGTKIGHCLRQFRMNYGDLLTSKATVMIFSDGWDIGEISILKHEMNELHKRTNALIWINPFLDSKDYAVETIGMKTALEYVDVFLSPKELVSGKISQKI